ncbi:ABC transporter ATP-binding protein [Symbiobacterium thermophilum]|uniref:ABC transporter ATP-binding protein n=2 Tax=Symbiobacterium thermophilum TaxID=2734 RepID=Q67JZ4_SYMTH|nr:ATP-binding cassette domain-containing protein [Symbiobacterium thermophilum]MBY6275880.1 ABC transporter ATP-binding protein [Symbiobacterium thermophilum]OTA42103.1 MAG: ABC transporter ATP-binding protein [Symbiobacterium thermophilum]BAD42006.1 ABC transporter ATP-binding protein [Symbiobacterium thermophilum IAM 14863]
MTGLTIEGVHKTFFPGTVNEIRALKGVDLTLAPGEFVTVVGSNGAGKSTLLNSVAGVIAPDRGRILLGDVDITRLTEVQRAARIGRVLQNPLAGTAPSLTVAENLALALARGRSRGLRWALTAARRRMFAEELAQLGLGLENRLDDKVGLLSGGQRQALSLLMATLQRPDVLLLDEHTAALDPRAAALIAELTNRWVRQHRLTTLMITHNLEQAIRLGDRLVMMHEGRILFTLSGPEKQGLTIEGLRQAFERVRGQEFSYDRAVLAH